MNILISYRHFPVAIGRYIHWALEMLGHRVMSAGPYSNGTIPWGPKFYYKDHKFPPTVETPDVERFPLSVVLEKLPVQPDIVIQAGDVFYLEGKSPVKNIIIATDPHAVDYHPRLMYADAFVSMQHHYALQYPNAHWMPYAYDQNIHVKMDKKILCDVCFCGLQYSHRVETVDKMREHGLRVFSTLGLIYDDYVKAYASGKIAFSYSSKLDLPARFWEGMAMGKMVLQSRVPDLALLPFKDGVHYVGFSSKDEAVEKALYYSTHDDEREKIAAMGNEMVLPHTYSARMKTLFDEIL